MGGNLRADAPGNVGISFGMKQSGDRNVAAGNSTGYLHLCFDGAGVGGIPTRDSPPACRCLGHSIKAGL